MNKFSTKKNLKNLNKNRKVTISPLMMIVRTKNKKIKKSFIKSNYRKLSINHSISQTINQSISSQSINQSINQSKN